MESSFTPSPDVSVALNALLDILERRTEYTTRSIKVTFAALPLPGYFSQANPEPRLIANEQISLLEKKGLLQLTWIPGETGHLLQSITLPKNEHGTHTTEIFQLLSRTPIAENRSHLESLLLADKFRFQDDWRARAISYILNQLKAEKSPSPFSLTDSNLNLDLLAVLQALPALTAETRYRVFSVRVFNDTKRFEAIKSHIVSLARLGNPEWKRISAEEVLRELNLVANPGYVHISGNWRLTTGNSEMLDLSGFTPSIGFPAAQISTLQSVHAEFVLCIENLTTFHQQVDRYTGRHVNSGTYHPIAERSGRNISSSSDTERTRHAVICTYGNPSPAIRRILRLLPKTTPIYLWADLDYGGFNILSQLRRTVGEEIQPCLMDIETLEANIPRARPLTASDKNNLKRLSLRPELRDVRPVIEFLLRRGVKLEQEGVEEF
jgi:hypothetical protein